MKPFLIILAWIILSPILGIVESAYATPILAAKDFELYLKEATTEETQQLQSYLSTHLNQKKRDHIPQLAELNLEKLKNYKNVHCQWRASKKLSCTLERQILLNQLQVLGLPLTLLKADLQKHIFLHNAQPFLEIDHFKKVKLERQKERIIQFLESKGYFGAVIKSQVLKAQKEHLKNVVLTIEGGQFIKVVEVVIQNPGPWDVRAIKRSFSRMCLTSSGILDGFETGRIACMTKQQLQSVSERLIHRLKKSGYPEAQLWVKPEIIDPYSSKKYPNLSKSCFVASNQEHNFTAKQQTVTPKCVRLHVKVYSGPKISTHIIVEGGDVVDDRLDPERFTAFLPKFMAKNWIQTSIEVAHNNYRSFRNDWLDTLSTITRITFHSSLKTEKNTPIYLSDLYEQLTFDEAASVDKIEAETSRFALVNFLNHKGYLNASVRLQYLEKKGHVYIQYRVHPGKISAVSEINFKGNTHFSSEHLKKSIALNTQKRALLPKLNSGFISRAEIENDIQSILKYYEDRGFADADVTWKGYLDNNGFLVINFYIDEGEAYLLSKMTIVGGNPKMNLEALRLIQHCKNADSYLKNHPPFSTKDCIGAPFRPEEIKVDAERIRSLYVENGFLYTNVDIMSGFSELGPSLEIRITDRSNPKDTTVPKPIKWGEIFIEGDHHTNQEVLLREFGGKTHILKPQEIVYGTRKLRRTGLFRKVQLEYIGKKEQSDPVDIRLVLEEKPSWLWDTSVSFSTNTFFTFGNTLRNRNFLDRMLDLSLDANIGLFVGRSSLIQGKLSWPNLLGLPISLSLTPSFSYDDHPSTYLAHKSTTSGFVEVSADRYTVSARRRNIKAKSTFSIQSKPFRKLDLTFALDQEWRLEWDDANAQQKAVFSTENLEGLDGLLKTFERKPQRISAITPRIRYQNINNIFDPSKGFSITASLRLGIPLPDFADGDPLQLLTYLGHQELIILPQLEGSYYRSFSNLTVALHSRAWFGFSQGKKNRKSTLLQSRLLTLGGDRSIRGYQRDRIGLPNLAVRAQQGEDITNDGDLVVAGIFSNFELRYTLIKALAFGDLKVATFVDAGLITYNDWDLTTSLATLSRLHLDTAAPRVGASWGVGLRYVLPVGPLSFDLGFPLYRDEQDPAWNLHVQLGYAF